MCASPCVLFVEVWERLPFVNKSQKFHSEIQMVQLIPPESYEKRWKSSDVGKRFLYIQKLILYQKFAFFNNPIIQCILGAFALKQWIFSSLYCFYVNPSPPPPPKKEKIIALWEGEKSQLSINNSLTLQIKISIIILVFSKVENT